MTSRDAFYWFLAQIPKCYRQQKWDQVHSFQLIWPEMRDNLTFYCSSIVFNAIAYCFSIIFTLSKCGTVLLNTGRLAFKTSTKETLSASLVIIQPCEVTWPHVTSFPSFGLNSDKKLLTSAKTMSNNFWEIGCGMINYKFIASFLQILGGVGNLPHHESNNVHQIAHE